MSLTLAYNTTDSAVVDEQGYSIGGRSWGVADKTDDQTIADYQAGRLIDADEDAARGSSNPDVAAALSSLDQRRERLEAAKQLDKDELLELADPAVVETLEVGASGEPAKADLVEAVADSDADLPAPAPKKSTSSRSAAKQK